jgi:hypothetical protein
VLGGLVGVLGTLFALYFSVGHALWWRERVQVGPGGFIVRRGLPGFRRRYLLPARSIDAIELDREGVRLKSVGHKVLPGFRIVLRAGKQRILVGTGLPHKDVAWLLDALRRARQAALAEEPRALVEWKHPVPPADGRSPRPWTAALLDGLRHPSPYLLFDVAVVLGSSALLALLRSDAPEVVFVWPALYLLFCVGLAVRLFDPHYLANLRVMKDRVNAFWMWYGLAGTLVGFQGMFTVAGKPELEELLGLSDKDPLLWASFALLAIAPVLHVLLLRRAGRLTPAQHQPVPPRSLLRELLVTPCMLGMAVAAELQLYAAFTRGSNAGRFGPLMLPLVVVFISVIYVPVRMHYFIDEPRNRRNWASFGFACLAMTVYAVGHG